MDTNDFAPFKPFKLSAGAHNGPQDGMCVMEMAGYLAGESWSDHPKCVCPIIASVCRVANDRMGQEQRDRLQSYLPRLIETHSSEHESDRLDVVMSWMWGEVLPSISGIAKEHGFAEQWETMLAEKTSKAARAAVRAADAAGAAAWSARAAAAWSARAARAAEDAVRAAAEDAVRAAAEDAVSAAVRAAVRASIWQSFFPMLKRMIDAGPAGQSYTPKHITRASKIADLVN